MIILINGPLGIGKTEVSWKLAEHFEHAVMLDGDYIGAVVPFEIYDSERIEYTCTRPCAIWSPGMWRTAIPISCSITSSKSQKSLARLRQLLSESSDEIYAFRLVCTEDAADQRIRKRGLALGKEGADLDWELHRFRELTQIQDAAAQRGDMGFVVDTTHLSAQGVADATWNNVREGVELLPYDPEWPAQFEAEKARLQTVLGVLALDIQHIGSTAIPGLPAKPVIDILVTVRQLDDASACIAPLQELGYTFVDYPQNTDRRFFRKGLPRTHHLHIVEQGSAFHRDHIDFRDALLAEPALCEEYRQLKAELAEKYKNDRAKYSESKGEFVNRVIAEWQAKWGQAE